MSRIFEESGTLDTNGTPGDATSTIDIDGCTLISFGVYHLTGAHNTHIVDLQCSLDGTNWHNVTGGSVTGVGMKGFLEVGTKHIRLRLNTAEDAASTVDWYIQGKN